MGDKFDLGNSNFYYGELIGPIIDKVMTALPIGSYDGREIEFAGDYDWTYPIDPKVVDTFWEGRAPYFDVEGIIEPVEFEPEHAGWDINAHAGEGIAENASVEIAISIRPGLELTQDLRDRLRSELTNVVPHEIHHLTQAGNPFQRPNCPATPPAKGKSYYEYFTSACEIPAFLIGFRSESAHRGEQVDSLMSDYLKNYVDVGRISNDQAEDIKASWLEHDLWTDEMKLSEHLLVEKSLTGNSLERVATHVADKAIEWLKDEGIRSGFAEHGKIEFKIDVELPETMLWLRDVYIRLFPDNDFNSTAAYEFTLDADDAQRQDSDMVLNLYMPQDYTDDELERLHVEIESDARHELEHSGQLTSVLMDVQKKMPDGEIWKSLQAAEDYYTSEAEVPAHVAALVMKSKRRDTHGADEVDRELNNIYHTGLSNGYSEEELSPLMNQMRDVWQYYLMSRWPEQDWPIEFRPEEND
tara:strand:+ start:1659 stop:3068 length:1410 start_codon:yes stop_codon:yes gene_type:complete